MYKRQVNIRVKAVGRVDKAKLDQLESTDAEHASPYTTRSVFFQDVGFIDTPVYRREQLSAEQRIIGPGIVDQLDTTTVIFPDEQGTIDRYGSIYIEQSS